MVQYLIAHDLGTTGNKATLFTTEGKLVKSITHAYETNFYNGNWAEQNPEDWWEAVCTTNHQLLEGLDKTQVAGLAFSGQMMGCVVVDKSGTALRAAIIWADQRSTEQEAQLREKMDEKAFYRITGHKISASYSIEKLMWIRDNQPELYTNVYKMLQPKDYVIQRLTGAFVTDYSDASGTNCFDLNRFAWSQEILDCAQIPYNLLPEVYPSTHIAGTISAECSKICGLAAGTKIIIGGGDGVCASVGAGSVSENVAYNYLGSSSWIAYASKTPVYDDEMRTFNWAHMVPGLVTPNGTMQAAGNSYHFLKEVLCDGLAVQAKQAGKSVYALMDAEIAASSIGAKGLIYLPYLLGERSPRWNSNARGAFIGLKMEHTKGDLLRAGVEGILMNLCIILDIFRAHSQIESIHIIGGLAKGAPVRQLLADIYGIPVKKLNFLEEATSMGAAVAAGVGAGVLADFSEIYRFIEVEECVMPSMDNHRRYNAVKRVFEESYQALAGVYNALSKL